MPDAVPLDKIPPELRQGPPGSSAPAAGGGEVPADKVPSDLRQGPPAKQHGASGSWEDDSQRLGPEASAVVRPVAEGVFGALTFVPDLVTDVVNLVPESALGPKTKSLGEHWESILDKYTTKPDTALGKAAEFGTSAMLGGGIATAARKGLKTAGKYAYNRINSRAAEEVSRAGYKLSPSYIGGTVSRTVQQMAGSPKVQKGISAANQEVTDRLAATELGHHGEVDFSDEFFAEKKLEAYEPYQEARNLGSSVATEDFFKQIREAGGRYAERGKSFGGTRFASIEAAKAPYLNAKYLEANDLVDEMMNLRASSKSNFAVRGAGAVEAHALAATQKQMADAMDQQIGRMAGSNEKLAERLQAARVQLSKIYVVENSIGAGGHVRASDFARLMGKGVPLTGGLKTIGTMATNFSKDVQHVAKEGQMGEFSVIDYMLGGTGIVEHSTGLTGLVLARPVARYALGTKKVQKSMIEGMRGDKEPGLGSVIGTGVGIEGFEDVHERPKDDDR